MAKNQTAMLSPCGSNKDWEARNDFCTLADAETIKKDPARYKAAMKVGPSVLKERKDEADKQKAEIDGLETALKGMNAIKEPKK